MEVRLEPRAFPCGTHSLSQAHSDLKVSKAQFSSLCTALFFSRSSSISSKMFLLLTRAAAQKAACPADRRPSPTTGVQHTPRCPDDQNALGTPLLMGWTSHVENNGTQAAGGRRRGPRGEAVFRSRESKPRRLALSRLGPRAPGAALSLRDGNARPKQGAGGRASQGSARRGRARARQGAGRTGSRDAQDRPPERPGCGERSWDVFQKKKESKKKGPGCGRGARAGAEGPSEAQGPRAARRGPNGPADLGLGSRSSRAAAGPDGTRPGNLSA